MPFEIAFERVTPFSMSLIEHWLHAPHVRRWWGDPVEGSVRLRRNMDEPSMEGFLVHVDGTPAGYIQAYPADALSGHAFGPLSEGAAALDMFLGEATLLGQGIGAAALRAMAERLIGEGTARVFVDPSPENAHAVNCSRKAGFRAVGPAEVADGPALVMLFDGSQGAGEAADAVSPSIKRNSR